MIHEFPLLRSLDPHHARLGYLGALSAVAVRNLDTYDAIVARFSDLLFERYYVDEPRYAEAMRHVDEVFVKELTQRAERDAEENPAAILAPMDSKSGWLTRSEFWLYDRRLPSHVGYLMERHAGRTVDLARWMGILLPTLDLSETGFLLQYLLTGGGGHDPAELNCLVVQSRPALTLLYMKLLFSSEILFPSLISELVERVESHRRVATRGADGLLRASVARLMGALGEPTDPEDVLAFREVSEFNTAVLKSPSTEENYLRPRLEMLVDVGVLERRSGAVPERAGAFPWDVSDRTAILARALAPLAANPRSLDTFLDEDFVATCAPAIGLQVRKARMPEEMLIWFARAYALVHREIGFTPGRTVAELASLLAAEQGVRLEMKELFSLVSIVPSGQYAKYFQFSGGSRFDLEFMIKVSPDLLPLLEEASRLDNHASRGSAQ